MPPSPLVCPELEPPNLHVFSPDVEYDPRDPPICCEHCGLTPEEFVASLPPEIEYFNLSQSYMGPSDRVHRQALVTILLARDGGVVSQAQPAPPQPAQDQPAPSPLPRTRTPLQRAAAARNWRLLTLRGMRSTLTRILAEHNRARPEAKLPEEDYARLAEILVKLEQVSGVVPPPARDPGTGYY